ncbi:hypothetical protein N431DRAFT_532425 [Stipitochalara longipes BDJ]|nr:hypothetical protein N431DRAFT_532425 [Stipitochalara longipes BDJ]
MSELIFALGPNDRYFLCDGWNPYMNNLPQSLESKLEVLVDTQFDYRSLKWLSCAFGPGESYILTMQQGNSFVIYHDGLPQKLVDWLFEPKSGAYLRDVASLKVTLGENGAFFAMDKNRYRWDGLPEKLEEFIQSGFSSKPAGMDMPRLVVLGNDKSFAVVTAQGRTLYSARPKLADAFDAITSTGQGGRKISFISIDAFSDESEFFITLDNETRSPMHHIRSSRLDLTSDTKAVTDFLNANFREKEKQAAAQKQTASLGKQAAAEQLTLASLNIKSNATDQGEDWSGLDYLESLGRQNISNSSSQGFRNWDTVENNRYAAPNYLSTPSQRLTSARSHPDLRSPNYAMQMAGEQVLQQQQQASYMSQRLTNSQAALAAQLTINRATESGAAAVLSSIW